MTQRRSAGYLLAALLSVALHALLLILAGNHPWRLTSKPPAQPVEQTIALLEMMRAPPPLRPQPVEPAVNPPPSPTPSARNQPPASMEAPPAPTAQEWALAAKYTLKNSKPYRHTWGQQVRSMMGTAVEGPDQGVVRFRIEIAPDGRLVRLETLWTTSPVAERLARQAIQKMPPLPPTPTGQPLIFEKTISFQPFAADGPPTYKDDCLPDPPAFRNPFAWDGKSPQAVAAPPATAKLDPQALEKCLRELPPDSIEAESAEDRRQLDRWGAGRQGR